jgi:hypothetical protein
MNDERQIALPVLANWYADPSGRAVQRYWNGQAWTPYVIDAQGLQRVDDPSTQQSGQPIQATAAAHGIVIQNIIQQPAERQPFINASGLMASGSKNTATALLLTFFFGPLGLFYVSAGWAIGMVLISLVAIPITLGLAAFVIWPIAMVMAVNMVNDHNRVLAASMSAPQPIHGNAPVVHGPSQPMSPNQGQPFNGQQSPPPQPLEIR